MGEGPLTHITYNLTAVQEVGMGPHISEKQRLNTGGGDLSKVTQIIYSRG